jgi:hypothetical protein
MLLRTALLSLLLHCIQATLRRVLQSLHALLSEPVQMASQALEWQGEFDIMAYYTLNTYSIIV